MTKLQVLLLQCNLGFATGSGCGAFLTELTHQRSISGNAVFSTFFQSASSSCSSSQHRLGRQETHQHKCTSIMHYTFGWAQQKTTQRPFAVFCLAQLTSRSRWAGEAGRWQQQGRAVIWYCRGNHKSIDTIPQDGGQENKQGGASYKPL